MTKINIDNSQGQELVQMQPCCNSKFHIKSHFSGHFIRPEHPRLAAREPDLGDDFVAVSGAGLTAEEVGARLLGQVLPPDGALADVVPAETKEGEEGWLEGKAVRETCSLGCWVRETSKASET